MTIGIWVLGDQLWTGQAALSSCEAEKSQTPVILIESRYYSQQRPYHSQKLVLVWSAMRHFAEELRSVGWQVTYKIAENFEPALLKWIKQNEIGELRVMTPNDRPFNFFYWDFLSRHQEQLKSQGRMNLVLGNLKRISEGELLEIKHLAADWREKNK